MRGSLRSTSALWRNVASARSERQHALALGASPADYNELPLNSIQMCHPDVVALVSYHHHRGTVRRRQHCPSLSLLLCDCHHVSHFTLGGRRSKRIQRECFIWRTSNARCRHSAMPKWSSRANSNFPPIVLIAPKLYLIIVWHSVFFIRRTQISRWQAGRSSSEAIIRFRFSHSLILSTRARRQRMHVSSVIHIDSSRWLVSTCFFSRVRVVVLK